MQTRIRRQATSTLTFHKLPSDKQPQMLMAALLVLLAWLVALDGALEAQAEDYERLQGAQLEEWRRAAVADFLLARKKMEPLCLYTFDAPLSDMEKSIDVEGAQLALIRGHMPEQCPFGDLLAEPALVTSLNTNESFFQLGVHLDEDPGKDPLRVQIASKEAVSAREFFLDHVTEAAASGAISNPFTHLMGLFLNKATHQVNSNGVGFEIAIRRRARNNQTTTLFAILNDLDGCADAGFRLDVSPQQELTFTYSIPTHTGEDNECIMHRFASSQRGQETCTLPLVADIVEETPPAYIMFTLNPTEKNGKWIGTFFVSYIEPVSKKRVDCEISNELGLPENSRVNGDDIDGNYRLYLGNHPRNLTSPRERGYSPKPREYRPIGGEEANKNATTRLRDMLRAKLAQVKGPEMPKALRMFKSGALTVKILGMRILPPVNEDTPFAMIRAKIEEFKVLHGEELINSAIEKLREKVASKQEGDNEELIGGNLNPFASFQNQPEASQEALVNSALTNADGATFDLFHFAIYNNVPTARTFKREVWNSTGQPFRMSPFRHFPSQSYLQRINEDDTVLLSLTQLLSFYNNMRLEILSLPDRGKILLFPNKTELQKENMSVFSGLPLESQQLVYFAPNLDDSNGYQWSSYYHKDPYASILFRIANSQDAHHIDGHEIVTVTSNATLAFYVNPKNDPPHPRSAVTNITVGLNFPISLAFEGDDLDGPKPLPSVMNNDFDAPDPSFLKQISGIIESMLPDAAPAPEPQIIAITQFPRYGSLYDVSRCSWQAAYIVGDASVLQDCQIESSTNATFPNRLMYVYRGWGRQRKSIQSLELHNNSDASPLDSLRYRISDGDETAFSDAATINFFAKPFLNATEVLIKASMSELNTAHVANMSEDSFVVITLAEVEPLGGMLSPQIRYKVTTLPLHGSLFQYLDVQKLESRGVRRNEMFLVYNSFAVGARFVQPQVLVNDPRGRILYVPEPNYFNAEPETPYGAEVMPLDFFEYNLHDFAPASTLSGHQKQLTKDPSAAPLADPTFSRAVKLRVVNEPDPISIMPPYVARISVQQGEFAGVPLSFADPDGFANGGKYQVELQADDGTFEFRLPQHISDDDVMSLCGYERPCLIKRTLNQTASINNDSELTYIIIGPFLPLNLVRVSGTMPTLQQALADLSVRDFSEFGWDQPHTVAFTFSAERANTSDSRKAQETIRVRFAASPPNPSPSMNIFELLKSRITQWLWTFGFVAAFVIISQNLPCCSTGFCCCLRAKARQKQRERFERKRREFQDRVAQNDYEYSLILMDLADVILQPDLLAAISLITSTECSRKPARRRLEQVLLVNSLLPVLESERQGTRFVFALLLAEFKRQQEEVGYTTQRFDERSLLEYPSAASLALSIFCRMVGKQWLRDTLELIPVVTDPTQRMDTTEVVDDVLDRLAAQVEELPVEIVILCRAVARLFASIDTSNDIIDSKHQLTATHLVFFNHFLGPVLLLAEDSGLLFSHSSGLESQRGKILHGLALALGRLPERWEKRHCRYEDTWTTGEATSTAEIKSSLQLPDSPDPLDHIDTIAAHAHLRFEALLRTIAASDLVQSSYEPPTTGFADNDLMALCLMNIHSYLDTHLGEFREQYKSFTSCRVYASGLPQNGGEDLGEDTILATETRVVRAVRALGCPMMSLHELVEHSQRDIFADSMMWSGWSMREWTERSYGLIRSAGEALHDTSRCHPWPRVGRKDTDKPPRKVSNNHQLQHPDSLEVVHVCSSKCDCIPLL